ncbi:hypothetical protein J7E62_02765 [Variovorax paradoxus]|nr:hypothetical protein [Variovorax paradoxus]
MIQLAMYKGKGMIGNAVIRAWTRSNYSHCELVDADVGVYMSSSLRDGGVRGKRMDLEPGNWDVFELPWADGRRVAEHFEQTRGQPYGWLDLLRTQFLNRPFDQEGSAFCSEWCAAALGFPNATSYSPRTLLDMCLYRGR